MRAGGQAGKSDGAVHSRVAVWLLSRCFRCFHPSWAGLSFRAGSGHQLIGRRSGKAHPVSMARRWSGFLAQNQEIKEQWGVLEESRNQIEERLQGLANGLDQSEEGDAEEDPLFVEAG